MSAMPQLMTRKELASALRKHVTYISAMKRQGFQMPGRVATLSSAIEFLQHNPSPRAIVRNAK